MRAAPVWALGLALAALTAALTIQPPLVGTAQHGHARTGAGAGADSQARDHLELGRHFFQRRAEGDLLRARQHFEQAIARQPDLVDAHAGLAGTYFIQLTEGTIDHAAGVARLGEAVQRALALDPLHAEARLRARNHAYALGLKKPVVGQPVDVAPDGAIGLRDRAIQAHRAGQHALAVALARQAVQAEPLSVVSRLLLSHALYLDGHLEAAEQASLEGAALGGLGVASVAARVMLLQGRLQEAMALSATWPDSPDRRQIVAMLHAARGDETAAQAALKALIASDGGHDPLRVAEVYAWRNERDEALRWLQAYERTRADPSRRLRMSVQPWMLGASPMAQSLRGDARFIRWMASHG